MFNEINLTATCWVPAILSPELLPSWSLFRSHLPRQGFPRPRLITSFQIWILGAINFPGDCCQWQGRKDLCNYHLYFHKTHALKSRARVLDNKAPGFSNAGKTCLTCMIRNVCLVRKTEKKTNPSVAKHHWKTAQDRTLSLPNAVHIWRNN